MNLNELKDRAYKIAKAHGWHDQELSDETYLMLIITEIAEAVNADRRNLHADVEAFKKYEDSADFMQNFERQIKDTVEDEISDVVIRCLDFVGAREMDLEGVEEYADAYIDKEVISPFARFAFMCTSVLANKEQDKEYSIYHCVAMIINYCKLSSIDIEWFVEQKMKYNAIRPYKHGGKKY